MDALEVFRQRRSIRKFKPDPVPDQDIEKILQAARLAPTARNIQPWRFVVIRDKNTKSQIASWASQNAPFIAGAPVCVAVFCQDTKYYLEDGSAATTQALLCAAALGYGGCWVAGDKKDYAKDVAALLQAPQDHKLVSLIAIGRPDESPAPQKKSLRELVHQERF